MSAIYLFETTTLEEIQIIANAFPLYGGKIYPEAIFKGSNGHAIICIKNNYWECFNPYKYSGPGTDDDWSDYYNVPIYHVFSFKEQHPELFI